MRRTCESPGRRPSPRQESVSLPRPPYWDTLLLTVTGRPGLHICAFPSTQDFQFLASRRASNLGASLYHCPWDVPPAAIFKVVLQSASVGHPAHWSLSGNISPYSLGTLLSPYCCDEIVLIQENKEFLCCMDTCHPLMLLKAFNFV